MRSNGAKVHLQFILRYGLGPWSCFFCERPVSYVYKDTDTKKRFNIHHKDGDSNNNDPENWTPSHHVCHAKYHRSLHPGPRGQLSAEGRRRISEAATRMNAQRREQKCQTT